MTATNKSKWYDSKPLLIILFFILPPLGIVGICKRNSVAWKKIVYILGGITMSFFLLICTIALFYEIDYYKDGNEYFHKGQYDKAVDNYNKVPKDNIHYTDAQNQLALIKQISDSLDMQKQIEVEAIEEENQRQNEIQTLEKQKQLEALITSQKHWIDSIRKMYGVFIVDVELNLPESILFELSGEATKHYNSNKRDVLPTFINSYKRSLSAKGYNADSLNTTIGFLPNKKLSSQSNNDDWTHPVMKNKGLKIYSGNEYHKEYIGTLSCKYKYEGSTYYRILKDNGKYTDIEDYSFSNCWVKRADSKAKQGIGLPTCY
ncbi:MAG: hypothetical protein E6772_14195 [Dysgonomonas sp.]|nr:hypothetical protein [Dysgonomonas sp.]